MEGERSICFPSSGTEVTNPCAICLQPILRDAYLDRCFHTFCYGCIAHWAKLAADKNTSSSPSLLCPLCKGENFSIIHDYDGHCFQQSYVTKDLENSFLLTRAHRYRLQCYHRILGSMHENFDVLQYWKCHRYINPNKWIQDWLRREIQALIQVEDVDVVVHLLHGIMESFLWRNQKEHRKVSPVQKREEFRALLSDAVEPFLSERSQQFVNELELFLVSGLNIQAYDELYLQCLNTSVSGASSSTSEGGHGRDPQASYLDMFDEDVDTTG